MKYLLSKLVYWLLTRAFVSRVIPHEIIRIDGAPYLTRFYLNGKTNQRVMGEGPQFYLHHFHKSDQGTELHNHPYTGTSLILAGGYIEERMSEFMLIGDSSNGVGGYTEVQPRTYLPGDTNEIGLEDFHRTDLLDKRMGCWTLFVTGARVKSWGFINRDSLDFFPYMTKEERRLGGGPHTRVKDAPNSDLAVRMAGTYGRDQLSERELIDVTTAERRAGPHQGTY